MVEKVVVVDVDEKLRTGRVWVVGASHGDRAAGVFEAVFAFVVDGFASGLFDDCAVLRFKAAALDHEAVDDAVKDRAVVMFLFHIIDEVGDSDWGFFFVEFEDDVAVIGFEADLGGGGFGGFGGGSFGGGGAGGSW